MFSCLHFTEELKQTVSGANSATFPPRGNRFADLPRRRTPDRGGHRVPHLQLAALVSLESELVHGELELLQRRVCGESRPSLRPCCCPESKMGNREQ